MKFKSFILFLACGVLTAMAGTVCPAGAGANPFVHSPDSAATGCNVIITVAASGTVSITVPDSAPYDGSEDTLIGVVNNSSTTIGSLNLTGTDVFGFDGDGICTFTFTGSGYCNASQTAGTDPQDYQGPTTTFVVTDAGDGTVNFSPVIAANGGTAYFSLEGVPTSTLTVTVTPGGAAPEPSSWLLVGGGFACLTAWRFRSRVPAKS